MTFTAQQAATYLRVNFAELLEYIERKHLPALPAKKVSQFEYLIEKDAIDQWLREGNGNRLYIPQLVEEIRDWLTETYLDVITHRDAINGIGRRNLRIREVHEPLVRLLLMGVLKQVGNGEIKPQYAVTRSMQFQVIRDEYGFVVEGRDCPENYNPTQ